MPRPIARPPMRARWLSSAIIGLVAVVATLQSAGAAPPTCFDRAATIVGTTGDDRLVGTHEVDVIVGGQGRDRISGLGQDDVICGGPADDTILAGSGVDRVLGGFGRDEIRGGPGRDRLLGGGGPDSISRDRTRWSGCKTWSEAISTTP